MKITDLARELGVSSHSLQQFMQDFNLDLGDCLTTGFDVKERFEKFARENAAFLKRYDEDLNAKKSVQEIAETIRQPVEKVTQQVQKQFPNLFDNGIYQSSVSSFSIDNQLGGNYQFVYDYFGEKSPLTRRDFIGYRDLFFYISDALEPFINPAEAQNWGIKKPAGIILYGPPGSGKIFWANKIAEIIGYEFKEIRKHYLGTSFSEGGLTSFNDFLIKVMKADNVLLFMEDFDEMMASGSTERSTGFNDDTQDIILHHISKFEKENVLMVGSAKSLENIDDEVTAPGRFDVLIPIFPPNAQERSEMILYYMTEDLIPDATLYKILVNNHADHLPFWQETAAKMKVFSNTMVIDFVQSLKKRIRAAYQNAKSENIKITQPLLDGALRDASAKLTGEFLDQNAQFLHDAAANSSDAFRMRLEALRQELDTYKAVEQPRREIGFPHNAPT